MGGGDGLKEVDGCVLHGVILMDALGIKPATPGHFFVPPGAPFCTPGVIFSCPVSPFYAPGSPFHAPGLPRGIFLCPGVNFLYSY